MQKDDIICAAGCLTNGIAIISETGMLQAISSVCGAICAAWGIVRVCLAIYRGIRNHRLLKELDQTAEAVEKEEKENDLRKHH